jgi:Zn-dependent protease
LVVPHWPHFGIDHVHATFFLLPAWVMLAQYARTQSVTATLVELLFVLLVFAIIVLHECGHALAARRFGVPTRDITLLPIGGVARLERMPENPLHEFLVAIAGPAVNVALAALLLVWLVASDRQPAWPDPIEGRSTGGSSRSTCSWSCSP